MTRQFLARLFRSPFTPEAEPEGGFVQGVRFLFAAVEQHHGWVEYADGAGGGTSFDLYLPRAVSAVSADAATGQEPRPRGARPTVLLAEAEPTLRDFGRATLESHGYRVLLAEDGVQAVERFRDSPERIDVAVIDLNLPGLTGDTVLARLLELDPDVEVVFSSGYFAEDRCEEGSHVAGVISKPYSRQELVRVVKQAVAWRTEAERHRDEGVRDSGQSGNLGVNGGRGDAEGPASPGDSPAGG
jgi:two-component system cell cycle sensor histidine kinase/response regulator CckA